MNTNRFEIATKITGSESIRFLSVELFHLKIRLWNIS